MPSGLTIDPSTEWGLSKGALPMPSLDGRTFLQSTGVQNAALPGTGGGGGGSSSGGSYSDLAGALIPLLASLFGPGNAPQKAGQAGAVALGQNASAVFGQGTATAAKGNTAIDPVLRYLMAVTGSDPGALMAATQPERTRLLDQYDTATKSLEFAPRGGGKIAAMGTLQASKATALADQTATARSAAVGELGTLGTALTQQGAQQQATGLQGAEAAVSAQDQQAAMVAKQHSDFGAALGKTVMAALPFILAL
jgi:hypothetical protein